jgi:hypothetical protein
MADIQREMAIRLAWYIDRYGGIPEPELIKLFRAATLGRKDEEAERIAELADQILEHFRSI